MTKQAFIQYLSESRFQELFITGMGWNNPKGQTWFDITIEETNYSFKVIAERNGFQVMTCQVPEIPTSSLAKKIDTRLRRQANDYICIYHHPNGSEHHLWAVPVKKVEKRDLVLVEYETAEKAGFLFEKVDGLSFGLDEVTTIMDVKERVQGAFIINSERITKDFYNGFQKEHLKFAKFITGIDDEITDIKKNRNKQWYTSVMLNRLMFCYFIQKKGFLDQNVNYLRDKLEWVRKEKGQDRFYGSFYQGFLLSLFHDGMNSPRHEQEFTRKYGRIPYLNGGMFDIHDLERQYPEVDIKDDAFESLFAFFDQWHWHLDDRLTATGKDINPDVLGYIFEQYINDRAQMGAYYTKEDITEYIGRNTIVPYLLDATKKADEKPFRSDGSVWQFLRESGDRYIFDAVKKGHNIPIPEHIAVGIDTTQPNLLERRSRWNERTPEEWALPTEIWRETVERLQRYNNIRSKIENGEIHEVNDFITYNLDIRQFTQDYLAQTDDHLFVLHFYHALQKVTILDPTCGSGAFLFAALNILEPLYETCIERMQSWVVQNPNLFKDELQDLNMKYRNNHRYFIYKSIILRNLYGVDIMVEATEIAKLRLFLKMVAVVDVNPRDPNLGLEPLPDVDFNIRCGNTLVGYATEKELQDGLLYTDFFAREEFEQKVNDEMKKVSKAYDIFKQVQLGQEANLDTYKQAKKELKDRLKQLNQLLNKNLHAATNAGMDYAAWEKSHQPFHWLAEYYDIIQGNGGFDVVIGNPPYVEYKKKDRASKQSVADNYKISGYKTEECGNLYAFVIERCYSLVHFLSISSFIIPSASVCTPRMSVLNEILLQSGNLWTSIWDERPSKLFDGVDQQLCIQISIVGPEHISFITKMIHWATECRKYIFEGICYCQYEKKDYVAEVAPKIQENIERKLLGSILSNSLPISNYINKVGDTYPIYYKNAGGRYWRLVKTFPTYFNSSTSNTTTTEKMIKANSDYQKTISVVLSSSLFYWYWRVASNCRHLTNRELEAFPVSLFSIRNVKKLNDLCDKYERSLLQNKKRSITQNKTSGEIVQDFYFCRLSKSIIDEIDKVLARHYGFTEEELDFIINYDIKYRMGDELNGE